MRNSEREGWTERGRKGGERMRGRAKEREVGKVEEEGEEREI